MKHASDGSQWLNVVTNIYTKGIPEITFNNNYNLSFGIAVLLGGIGINRV